LPFCKESRFIYVLWVACINERVFAFLYLGLCISEGLRGRIVKFQDELESGLKKVDTVHVLKTLTQLSQFLTASGSPGSA
jgi:hypothetical protein